MALKSVTSGHIWSQVVTLVTDEVKNHSNDDPDGYYDSTALNQELFGRVRRNASLIDLLASPQVKTFLQTSHVNAPQNCTVSERYLGTRLPLRNVASAQQHTASGTFGCNLVPRYNSDTVLL